MILRAVRPPFVGLAIVLLTAVPTAGLAQSAGVLREVYTGIQGTTIPDLLNAPAFPANPTQVEVLPTFEAPTDVNDYYGQRLTAYLLPAATGDYTFWIASDDNSVLYLSTDSTPVNKVAIASVPGWTASRSWGNYAEQMSQAVRLTGGQRYYVEALMKEGSGGDNLAVRWQLPNGTIEEPIPGNRLQVYGLGPPQIAQQPASVTVTEGGSATFSVQLAWAYGASYQWQRGTANITGATGSAYTVSPVSLSDNNAQFRCVIANGQGSTNSSYATLTVQADTTPPTITSVVNLGDNTLITVTYSEPVQPVSATNRLNYGINNGVTVQAASFGGDSRSVVLRTSPLSVGVVYTLTVNNVRDRATTPNTIAPNTQRTFTLDFTPLDAANLHPNREPLGPSSRRTGLVISEIMYHPTNRLDGRELEFIELYNSQVFPEDLSGFRLSGDIDYRFPANTTIPAGGYLVVAPVPADVQSAYGISGVLGGFTNRLSNSSGTIRLRNRFDAVLLEVEFSDDPPWPAATDGAGHSLILARPTYGEANVVAWEASDLVGGTPGAGETPGANPYRAIVINEFLAHTDPPDVDYIELYNYSASPVNLTGCILTDDPDTNRFVLPSVTIPARGFLAFYEANLGFALSASGETIYLKNPAGNRVIDAVRFSAQQNGIASGRFPDGAPGIYHLMTRTPGASNGRIRVVDVVINEIMYHPITGNNEEEYVELHNRGASAVNLAGWEIVGGIDFTFSANAVIPAGGYVVAANSAVRLLTNYPGLNANNTFGNFGGSLGNGERLALTMPDTVLSTNGSTIQTNIIHIEVDEVSYRRGGRWGKWADGGGSSLELTDPRSDHRQASNWADSDESAKSGWSNIEFTGVLDHGNGAADSLHIILQGAGECLVDNVEVFRSGGANLVANPGFESNFTGWFPKGTHEQSYWQVSGGFGAGKCLHLVASARGDTGANHVRTPLSTALSAGDTVTLRAKVRWLKGNPEILLRLHGNWLEAYGNIAGARNLGTPGALNSRSIANSGPSIKDVSHSPLLPASGQTVTIQARVGDPDGLASLVLKYRVDPLTNISVVPMIYNGAGMYTAPIPGQSDGKLVAFHIEAADYAGTSVITRFPDDAPTRECLVRFGEWLPNTGRVGTYRFWFTQATNDRWTSREKNSNQPLDATFVYNNSRVVYNIGTLYSGSPWHTPGYNGPLNNICDYVIAFPEDDLMLGTTDFVLASLGNLDSDSTTQREQAAFWILGELGVPTLYRRHVNLFVNGRQRGLCYEDSQQPSGDVVEQWFPDDSDGNLHKIEDWFEFDNSGDNKLFNVDATLQNFTTTGGAKKLARYRWNWRKRAVKNSANDYTDFFQLVNAVNAGMPEPYNSQVQRLVDIEEWARVIAVERLVGNWDSYGFDRGKNMYTYKPERGKWTLLAWDIDFVLDNGGYGPDSDMNPATMSINDGVMRIFLTFPAVERAWWRALQDAVNGPLVSSKVSAMMNAKYQGLAAAGLPVSDPSGALSYLATRRGNIQTLLANYAFNFTVAGGNFSTGTNYVVITGTAPIAVSTIKINGIPFPVTWTTVSSWRAVVALNNGANVLTVTGHDLTGNLVANSTATITVTYTGTVDSAQDHLVINEIMYNPALPDASFIELHNTSTRSAFDLSAYRLDGADCVLPGGTVIAPGGFLVVANNASAFATAYGGSIPLAAIFAGRLENSGETLKLVKPGATPAQDIILDEVSYSSALPWPTAANGFGPSLQLIDPTQDNNRVMNWAVPGGNPQPQWQYVTLTGTATSSRLYIYLNTASDVYIDDLKLVAGSVPEVGQNYIQNGSFETALTGPWQTTTNTASSAISSSVSRVGGSSLRLVCNAAGDGVANSLWQDTLPLTVGNQYTLSFWFLEKTNAATLTMRLSLSSAGTGISASCNLQQPSPPAAQASATPGTSNSVRANLSVFPLLWLNEAQPNNATGIQDNAGEREPWVEVHNSGSNIVDLAGYYLSDNYASRTKWAFPAGTQISPGQFRLVWLDNEPTETGGTNLHVNFRASSTNGSLVLTKVSGTATNAVDYLNYRPINNDRSYGAFPDGTPARRHTFYYATPGAPNNNTWPGVPVVINEWMASNNGTIPDPADGKYSDWFELHNAGPSTIDLSGYYLANNPGNPNQYEIPAGCAIESGGFLLVWADEDPEQNEAGAPLHADFRLSASGESIALFSPVGVLLESVTFGQQTNDISQGRWPDGNSGNYYFMETPTPGRPNILGVPTNQPPSLAAIPDQTAYQGTPLSFTAIATDPDAGQTLAFSLDATAPLSAFINSDSGVFTWTPTQADPPAIYSIIIRATDNGFPPLSDEITVLVTVLAPPPLKVSTITLGQDGRLTLSWATQPQKNYRVSYTSDLSQPDWITLVERTATGTELSITDDLLENAQRFYRIELLD